MDEISHLSDQQLFQLHKCITLQLQKQSRDPFRIFPHEINERILLRLPMVNIVHLQQVCKFWFQEIESISWRKVYELKWPYDQSIPQIIDTKWKDFVKERYLLEKNWRFGRYTINNHAFHSDHPYTVLKHGGSIYTGSRDKQIYCWDSERCLQTYRGHMGSVLCLAVHKNYLFSGSSDNSIICWDIHTATILKRFLGHSDAVLGLQVAQGLGREEYHLVSCSKDHTIKIWDSDLGVCKYTLVGHTGSVNDIQICDSILVSCSSDRTVKIWDLVQLREVRSLKGHLRGIGSLQFNGQLIVSGSCDGEIRFWDLNGRLLKCLAAHHGVVRTLALFGTKLVSGSYDQTIKVWDLETFNQLLKIRNLPSRGIVLCVYADDTKIIASFADYNYLCSIDFAEDLNLHYLVHFSTT